MMRGHAVQGSFTSWRRRMPLWGLIGSGFFLCASVGCSNAEGESTVAKKAPPPIEADVVQVTERDWPREVATQGNLVADETTVIGAKVAGRIDTIEVDLGDAVESGAVIASLDRTEYSERVRQAEAELNQARAAIGLKPDDDLEKLNPNNSPVVVEQKALWDQTKADRERLTALRARQAVTEAQFETIVANEQAAEARHRSSLNSVQEKMALVRVRTAQLALARQEYEEAVIRAPFTGRVQERHIAPGTYVQVGDSVVTLIRDDPLRYRGTVPEPYAASIGIGQKVQLRLEGGPTLPEVAVTRISPALDPYSRSLLFEALVPNPDRSIQAGQFTQGAVVLDQSRQVLAVPKSAIVAFAGIKKVWKVVDGQAVEQAIETGVERNDLVEIIEGVTNADVVLFDGAKGRAAEVKIQGEVPAQEVADTGKSREEAVTSRATDVRPAVSPQ